MEVDPIVGSGAKAVPGDLNSWIDIPEDQSGGSILEAIDPKVCMCFGLRVYVH